MHKSFKWAAVALPVLAILFACGCGIGASYPNQINAFDGATYSSLLLAHGALTSLRASVSSSYPKYAPIFNEAGASYNTAYTAYAGFRSQPTTQAEVTVLVGNLVISMIALENAFQADMQVSPTNVAAVRARANRMRASAKLAHISVSDILTELEIAAAIARAIPPASAYAALAQVVIESTSSALAAETAAAGQPIDLSPIQPIPAIQ